MNLKKVAERLFLLMVVQQIEEIFRNLQNNMCNWLRILYLVATAFRTERRNSR